MPPRTVAATSAERIRSLTRVTVNITPRATWALVDAAHFNRESRTNVVNRAIHTYAFLTRMMRVGWQLVLRDPRDGSERRVDLF
jgi:hypothetical protein